MLKFPNHNYVSTITQLTCCRNRRHNDNNVAVVFVTKAEKDSSPAEAVDCRITWCGVGRGTGGGWGGLSRRRSFVDYVWLQFKRATVQNYKTGELEIANYRISKSAWLQEHEHKHVQAVSRRVEHMTSLSVETAEELQVVNYGIGGHYEPHFDFARVRSSPFKYPIIRDLAAFSLLFFSSVFLSTFDCHPF